MCAFKFKSEEEVFGDQIKRTEKGVEESKNIAERAPTAKKFASKLKANEFGDGPMEIKRKEDEKNLLERATNI